MFTPPCFRLVGRALACWNWKCALLSATVRSLVYLAAMGRSGGHGRLAVVLVEMAYVTLTAGIYAGMQQRALLLQSRLAGNLIVVLGVPALAQVLDWFTHCAAGATVTDRATFAVGLFTIVSALFHLYVMRNGVFLTGQGRTLGNDFRRMPRLIVGFVVTPAAFLVASGSRIARTAKAEVAF